MYDNKKILFYIDILDKIGGAQRVMYNLICFMKKKKYKTVVVTDYDMDSSDEYILPDGVNRYILNKMMHIRRGRISRNVNRIFFLRKIIRSEKPDVVISFLGPINIRTIISTIGIDTRTIVSVRNDPYIEYSSNYFLHWLYKKLFNLADGAVFQTEDAGKYFSCMLRKKSVVIMNGVDESFYKYDYNQNGVNIISMGRIESQKNFGLLLDAFSRIAEEYPNDKLIIYGDGTEKKLVEEIIHEKGLENKVVLPGNTDQPAKAMHNAKLFILSSDFEGMPNALMEAMAVGVPVISTDCPCGGPRMLIRHGIDGILVPCGDVDKMVNAMRTLLNSPELRQNMGIAAHSSAKKFMAEVVFQEWERYLVHG